jgi:hypothetical protein
LSSSTPTLTTLETVVEALRMWEPDPTDFAMVESVEPALVDGVDGLTVLWAQGSPEDGYRHFGLVATAADIARLALSNGGHFRLSNLHLMLVEPHAAGQQPRTWFRSTADFDY